MTLNGLQKVHSDGLEHLNILGADGNNVPQYNTDHQTQGGLILTLWARTDWKGFLKGRQERLALFNVFVWQIVCFVVFFYIFKTRICHYPPG